MKESRARSQSAQENVASEAAREPAYRPLQRSAVRSGPVAGAPPLVRDVTASPGQPLDPATRDFMEPRFGHDFSQVRVHTDAAAAASARAVNANAYTIGNRVAFAEGRYAPSTPGGRRLIAHELAHVVQQSGAGIAEPEQEAHLESEADMAADAAMRGVPMRPVSVVALRLSRQVAARSSDDDTPNPLADWHRSPGSILMIQTNDSMYILPGGNLVWTPTEETQRLYEQSHGHLTTDLGALFEVPATGASGTRVFRAGTRSAIVIDAGSDPGRGVPAAVYMSEVQGVMASLGVTNLSRMQIIHAHRDHISAIPQIIARYNVRASNVIIPAPYVGFNDMRRIVTELQTTTAPALVSLGFGSTWTPGSIMRDRGGPGDVLRYSYTVGQLRVESIALRSALRNVAANPDLASYMTKVTRADDGASVVVLGDVRGSDLETLRTSMETQRMGSWNEFFQGVTTLSGFSHHVGRMEDRDIPGMMALLDATLVQQGRLRVVEQTNLANPQARRTRLDTLELTQRLGLETSVSEMPAGTGATPSGAGATRSTLYARGPAASRRPTIASNLTTGYERVQRLLEAKATIETWRPWLNEINNEVGRQFLDSLLPQIDQSVTSLRQSLRSATEAAMRVRTGGAALTGGGRDYSATGGARGAAFETQLQAIPATTAAETSIGPDGFTQLASLRNLPEREIPLRVAVHAAITRGEYSEAAFAHMLASLDTATRNELLTGPRGGLSPRRIQFERVRAEYNFRRSVLGSGETWSLPRSWSPRARAGATGLVYFQLALEVWNNIVQPLLQAHETSQRMFSGANLLPFVRRTLFWNRAGVMPRLVAVHDPVIGSPTYYSDATTALAHLNSGDADALYFNSPGLEDLDVFRFGVWLSYNIRNFDEFATFFIDSGQDAVTWDTPGGAGWNQATWKVRVGRYETSGENHVVESWYDHPNLTRLMQAYVPRIISNTQELLAQTGPGQRIDEQTSARLGELEAPGAAQYQARLRQPSTTTPVFVETLGSSAQWSGDSRSDLLPRDVTWWSPPVFWVLEHHGAKTRVRGADYNTYAVLRQLPNESHYIGTSGSHLNAVYTRITGNETGTAWIDRDLLTEAPSAQAPAPTGDTAPNPAAPATDTGGARTPPAAPHADTGSVRTLPAARPPATPRVTIGPLDAVPGSDRQRPTDSSGLTVRF